MNRHTLIQLLEDAIDTLDDVVAKGDHLRRLSQVQERLMDAVLWLDPARLEEVSEEGYKGRR